MRRGTLMSLVIAVTAVANLYAGTIYIAPSIPGGQHEVEIVMPEPPAGTSYQSFNLRDPFRSIIGLTPDPLKIDSLLTDELVLQGTVGFPGGIVAVMGTPDKQSYLLRVGDRTYDGEVLAISATSIVFRQDGREVVRSLEPAKSY